MLGLLFVILTVGCDTAVDLSDDPAGVQPSPEVGPQAASVDLSAMTSVAPDGRTYGCALSSYTGADYEQAYQYRYAQLAFPESAIGRPAEVQRLTYRLRNENDRVLRQATCLIPKPDEARDLVLDWVSLTDVSPGLISASDVEGADTEESTFFDEDNDEVPPWECFPLPGFGLWCNEAVVEADRPTGGGGSQDDDWGNDWDPDDIFDDWDYPDQPGGPGGGDSDGDDDENCTEESEDTTPPTEGETPCGPACYDPPTDEPNDDGPGGDGPHDAPGFLTGVTWQVVTSSGLVAAPYDLVQHALMNAECDPEPPCESDDPPEYCDEAGSCFDAEIGNEEHKSILEAMEAQDSLNNLWEDTNFGQSEVNRLEQGGFQVPNGYDDGYTFQRIPSSQITEQTPCKLQFQQPANLPEGTIYVHTHPYERGEQQDYCGTPIPVEYSNEVGVADRPALQQMGLDEGLIIDADRITFFRADGSSIDGYAQYDRCGY